jgi:hypothetical protein
MILISINYQFLGVLYLIYLTLYFIFIALELDLQLQ